MAGNRVRHRSEPCGPMCRGMRQVQVKPESQLVGQGSDQKGEWPHTSMVQLETAVLSLRQGLRTLGAHGQEMWGLLGRLHRPAMSVVTLAVTELFLFGGNLSCRHLCKESPARNFKIGFFHPEISFKNIEFILKYFGWCSCEHMHRHT